MAVIDGIATLTITSRTRTADFVSKLLGITPSVAYEIGDMLRNGRGEVSKWGKVFDYALWEFEIEGNQAELSSPNDDTTDFGSLSRLVELFRPRANQLETLRVSGHCEILIRWSGDSGSSQGGFVLPIELLRGLAELGCNFHGNLYSFDEKETG